MSYVDYEYYSGTFSGSLPEEQFNKLEPRAEALIKYFTYIRGDIFATEDEAVKQAVCTAVDCIASNTTDGQPERVIASESNDGYSVSYGDVEAGATAETRLRRRVYEAIKVYLLPTGWLNRRVDCGNVCRDYTI